MICFGTLEFAGKNISGSMSPISITAWRFFIGGSMITLLVMLREQRRLFSLKFTDILRISIPGIVNVCFAMLFLQYSVYYGKASVAAILVSANPVFVTILGKLILDEDFNMKKILGIATGLFGIALIVLFDPDLNSGVSSSIVLGILYGLASSFCFGLYTVLSKKYVKRYGNLTTTGLSFLIGSLLLLTFGSIKGVDLTHIGQPYDILWIFYLGIIVSGIAYLSYFQALKHIHASTGAMFFFLKPVVASFLAYFLLRETLSGMQIAGTVLIITGIFIGAISNSNKKTSQKLVSD